MTRCWTIIFAVIAALLQTRISSSAPLDDVEDANLLQERIQNGKGKEPVSKMQDPDTASTHSEPLESQNDHPVSRTRDAKSLYGCRAGQTRSVLNQPNQYEICYNGQWWVMRCPDNGFFHVQLQVCVISTGAAAPIPAAPPVPVPAAPPIPAPATPYIPAPAAPFVPAPATSYGGAPPVSQTSIPAFPHVPAPAVPHVPAPAVPHIPAPAVPHIPAPAVPHVPAPAVPHIPAPAVPHLPAPPIPRIPAPPVPHIPAPAVPHVPAPVFQAIPSAPVPAATQATGGLSLLLMPVNNKAGYAQLPPVPPAWYNSGTTSGSAHASTQTDPLPPIFIPLPPSWPATASTATSSLKPASMILAIPWIPGIPPPTPAPWLTPVPPPAPVPSPVSVPAPVPIPYPAPVSAHVPAPAPVPVPAPVPAPVPGPVPSLVQAPDLQTGFYLYHGAHLQQPFARQIENVLPPIPPPTASAVPAAPSYAHSYNSIAPVATWKTKPDSQENTEAL